MSHRLRLYFGSARSNTAPESERLNGTADGRGEAAAWNGRAAAGSAVFQMPPRNGELAKNLDSTFSDAPLKQSSSVFIPQLQGQYEQRTTKSTSVLISLQRTAASQDDAPSHEPPPQYPQEPAPAYTEPGDGWSLPPPPAYCGGEVPSYQSLQQTAFRPKRPVVSVDYGAPQEISLGGFRIHRGSLDSSDVQHFSIKPHNSEKGQNCRWSVKPGSFDGSGSQRLVFQIQQDAHEPSQGDLGFTGTKGSRLMRYPRIRLERSVSQPLRMGNDSSRLGSVTTLRSQTSEVEAEGPSVESRGQGCTFKIRQEPTSRQFQIYLGPAGEHSPVVLTQDTSNGKIPNQQLSDYCEKVQNCSGGAQRPLHEVCVGFCGLMRRSADTRRARGPPH